MFSGQYIQHQELNRTDTATRVIQIWYVADVEYMGLAPHYEQIKLADMQPRQIGDATVRDIIGPNGATDSHVSARLTSTIVPSNGQTTIELPQENEDLFLYFVDGNGRLQSSTHHDDIGLYDVIVATPEAETAVIQAGNQPLNYLSFYLNPFI